MRHGGNNNHVPVWRQRIIAALTLVILVAPAGVLTAQERVVDIVSLFRAFGIGYVVDRFGPELNELINTLTFRHGVNQRRATKVVPIVSVGSGAYVGAAQVSGPADRVAQVEAVGQLKRDFFTGGVRAKALVPLLHKNPLEGIKRVDGVGITAIVDLNVESVAPQPDPRNSDGDDRDRDRDTDDRPPREGPPWYFDGDDGPFGYLIYAEDSISVSGNHNRLDGDIYARDDVRIRGNSSFVMGRIHAGDDVSIQGQGNSGKGKVYEVKGGKGGKSNGKLFDARSRDEFSLISFDPGVWRRRTSRTYRGDVEREHFDVRGTIRITGDLELEDRGQLTGWGVVVVEGDVELDTRSVTGPDLLIVAKGDIKIKGNNARIEAGLVSTNGSVKIEGNNIRIRGFVAGRHVKIEGNNTRLTYDDAPLKHL